MRLLVIIYTNRDLFISGFGRLDIGLAVQVTLDGRGVNDREKDPDETKDDPES